MSSNRKVWKECNYVKNDHSRDSQTSLSQSRSSQSFRFSQIKFNKAKDSHSKTSKKFAIVNTSSRVKEFKQDRSFLQQSNRMKQNSMIEIQPKSPTKLTVKTSKNRQFESKIKGLLYGVKKIHQDMKFFAENLLYSFQQMKNQLETNLLQVSSEIMKLDKSTSEIEKVHQIFHKGFQQIRRVITILPDQLTKLNNEFQSSIKQSDKIINVEAQSPLLKLHSLTEGRPSKRIVQNFNFSKRVEPLRISQTNKKKDFDLPQMSKDKLKNRPSTQRCENINISSFEGLILPSTHRQDSKTKKQSIQEKYTVFNKETSLDQVTKIDDIIFQMRLILNQSN